MDLRCCFKNKQNKSFTLIELLVVIAIIGLLSSIVLVSMQGVRDKAKIAKGLEFSQSVQHALGAYAAGWWSFETIEAGKVIDGSGYGNDGTVSGATVVASGMTQLGNALNFDGNDYVNAGGSNNLKPTGDITIEFWVKPSSAQLAYADIISAHAYGYAVEQNGSNPNQYYFEYYNGSSWQGQAIRTTLTSDVWQHFLVQKEGTTIKHFLNGIQSASGSVSGNISYSPGLSVFIGRMSQFPQQFFNGTIDEVRIYERALAFDEIQKHYTEGLERHEDLVIK